VPTRLTAITLASLLASSACVTTTAHRLVLVDHPMREQAITCEAKCRPLGASDYATCLDNCPGARAKEGSRCTEPPRPDVICVETTKTSDGGIGGAIFAAAGTALAIGIIHVVFGIFAGIAG
jgi:hypothetical protein